MIAKTSETSIDELDQAIACLQNRKRAWVEVSISQRLMYLEQCSDRMFDVAEPWATAACHAKGIDPNASLAGEEWFAGPVATMLNLRSLIKTLAANGQPTPVELQTRADGQQVARVFPDNVQDQVLWFGFRGEVWLEPDKPATQGKIYRQADYQGDVALVLGAGNISAISAMDMLYKLFAENQVVLLKMNPVNEYVGQFLEKAFEPLIADGFFQIAYGGAAVGRYLCNHRGIDAIHITGSQQTHDAIAWGNSLAEQADRKATNTPANLKPITSELGSITPIVIVPGKWSAADLEFQAQHVASMVAHNASFNCVAGKVLVLARGWPQRTEFLRHVRQALANTPLRKAYYPGAQDRYQAFLDRYPQAEAFGDRTEDTLPWTLIPDVPAESGEYALTTEAFCGVLAEVTLPADDAGAFLPKAVDFVNETLWGNLSCVILVDGTTQKRYKQLLDSTIANLRVGCIGINVWTAIGFSISALTWGAFPGNPLHAIQSGRGVVHNSYLFDHPQKSVLYAPFRIMPTPTWFANHKSLRQLAVEFVAYQRTLSWSELAKLIWAGLQG
jgi:acyl-CoA reductase-like NAD-dependent aldehyde dehydrogenase